MSKLSFRARALDASKPLPIYHADEIPTEATDCSLINRAVPQMPTGMEKEEETEHHLQQAIESGTVIPTPEVFILDDTSYYNKFYPENYRLPRQLIYMQPFSMETDIPDYDMDSEDEQFVNSNSGKLELTPDKFEEMMDRLEKGSGQTVVSLQDAKALIKEDDDLIIAVFDYWLNKRLKIQQPLIPHVRTEARHGVANHNPYIAFRRRTEKMQTRKNRKNDESSYEKMLKLKRELTRACTLLEMVKKREKSKRELLHLTIEVFEKRTQAGDYSGQIVAEVLQQRPARPAFTPLFPNSLSWNKDDPHLATLSRKERRQYKKRRHKSSSKSHGAAAAALNYASAQGLNLDGASSEEDALPASPSDNGEEEEEGVFSFRRKKDCEYLPPTDNSYFGSRYSKDEIQKRLKFYPASIRDAKGEYRFIGPVRRRLGRGGRVILDRMSMADLRELNRVMGYVKTPSSPPPSSIRETIPNANYPSVATSLYGDVKIKQEPGTILPPAERSPSPENFSSAELGCWHHFRSRTPDPLDTGEWLMISESEPSAEDVIFPDAEATEEALLTEPSTSDPVLKPSYHLGLVSSRGDRPLTFPLQNLLSDPDPVLDLDQGMLPSHTEPTLSKPIILSQQAAELENTLYVMNFENEFNSLEMETDSSWLPMDVDDQGGVVEPCSFVDFGTPQTNPPGPGPPNPPSNPSSSSSALTTTTTVSGSCTSTTNATSTNSSSSSNNNSSKGTSHQPVQPDNSSSSSNSNNNSKSTPPQTQRPDSSPSHETTVVSVKSGEETNSGKSDTDTSKSSQLHKSGFPVLISV